jgi:1,4-dihydroxy-2-naphthoate octaprenyltransferase
MESVKAWISAARLRTLPLSVSGILVGSGYAIYHDQFDAIIFTLAIITTLLFQILSNFANDYGDGVKGTDNENRLGPARAFQTGTISKHSFKKGIIITAILSFIAALTLIILAFGFKNAGLTVLFLVLGLVAIWAAIKYTIGDSAYGYIGLGDLFVFLFFGLVSVCGSYALYTQTIDAAIVLAGISIGLLSTAVLNLNNMRDYFSDKASNKRTLVVKMGQKKSKIYHFSIISLAIILMVLFFMIAGFSKWVYLSTVTAFILAKHLEYVYNNKNPGDLDQELKKVALSTFGLAFIFFVVQFF